jgi:hypothetical protein
MRDRSSDSTAQSGWNVNASYFTGAKTLEGDVGAGAREFAELICGEVRCNLRHLFRSAMSTSSR